jgi:hypothetical protein
MFFLLALCLTACFPRTDWDLREDTGAAPLPVSRSASSGTSADGSDGSGQSGSGESGQSGSGSSTPTPDDRFTVIFIFDNGSGSSTDTTAQDGSVTEPTTPIKDYPPTAGLYKDSMPPQYDFDGWYYGNKKWDFLEDKATENITLTARWYVPNLITAVPENDVSEAVGYVNDLTTFNDPYILVVSGKPVCGTQTLNAGSQLTIQGLDSVNGTITLSGEGALFTVDGYSANLTLGENITLEGRTANTSALVVVQNGASLVMEQGSKITGNENTGSNGYGSGVYLTGNSTQFTMNDGEISGNEAKYGGGVYIDGAVFIMLNGRISGNEAEYGGGVFVATPPPGGNTFFMMNNGTISGNTAQNGGGVFATADAYFTMSGGTISDNTAAGNDKGGGGVCIDGASFTMNGNAVISKNTATNGNGGGVYVGSGGTLNLDSGGIIYGTTSAGTPDNNSNTANSTTASDSGHAVYVAGGSDGGTFKKNGTAVSGGTFGTTQEAL